MEKQSKLYQDKILKFLPRAASVTFQNPPFSPNRDNRRSDIGSNKQLKAHVGRGFSGPIISMIPDEARRKPKNRGGFEAQEEEEEPTSPKVSCMGQIKHTRKIIKKSKRVSQPPVRETKPVIAWSPRDVKKHASAIRRIFSISVKPGRRSNASSVDDDDHKPSSLPDRAPSLSQMKRFASGRDHPFSKFDWAAQVAPVDKEHRNITYSDEEREGSDQEDEEEAAMIPFSAPLVVGGGAVPALQPRKEINLWKRRTMAPPRPLDLHTMNMIRAN